MTDVSKLMQELSPEQKRALLAELIRKKAAKPKVYPMSFGQQRLWFLDQLVPGNPFYNEHNILRLQMPLNVEVLRRSLNEIVRRHAVLRTTFALEKGEPVQVVSSSLNLELPVLDLRSLTNEERAGEAVRLATVEARTPFHLEQGPLIRTTLLRLDESDYVFLLTMHHIISDGWSMGIFFRELTAIFEVFMRGQPSPLPELPIQYYDFAVWQRQWMQGEVMDQHLAYWRQRLADLPTLQLPTDRPRPAIQTFQGASLSLSLSSDLTNRLKALSQQEDATLFMTLLAAFNVLLHRYTRQHDIVIGAPIAGRNQAELEPLIGFFVNALVLRADLSGNPTFRQLLKHVREGVLGALEHQDLPFEKLVEELQPERDLSRNPLFQVAFQLFNPTSPAPAAVTPVSTAVANTTNTPQVIEVQDGAAKVDLRLDLWQASNGLEGRIEYSTDLFEAATIRRLVAHFHTLLEGLLADPDRRVGNLPLLTDAERRQVLVEWNDTWADYPQDTCLHHLFEAQVESTPEAVAVVSGDREICYEELNRQANRLAHSLRKRGVGPETLVGICFESSIEMIVAILGVLKSGGAFIPLDPDYPQQRLAFILEETQAQLVLTHRRLLESLPLAGSSPILLDLDTDPFSGEPEENPTASAGPGNLAYIIYTSGSTGTPKGVLVEHRGLCNVVTAQRRTFNLQPGDRLLQFFSFGFDGSIFEILLGLMSGTTVYMEHRTRLIPGAEMIQLLQQNQITFSLLPPSALAALPPADLPLLRTIAVAGEACPADLVARWAPNRRFFNLYGPTEITIWATVAECRDGTHKPPIGRPITNTRIYLLDEYQNPVPVGVPGEIYIGGVGVSRGYLNRPDLTTERFVIPESEMLIGNQGSTIRNQSLRLYRTGDLGRWLPDGNIEFLERVDNQVKLRGFRIELGEIEANLRQHPGVQEGIVLLFNEQGQGRLVAYVVPAPGVVQAGFSTTLQRHLRRSLPEYMLPSAYVFLEALPLSGSGKIDRRRLPAPEIGRPAEEREINEPQTEMERRIAAVWAEVLKVSKVSRDDNFFEIGGHSLLMALIQDRLQETTGVSVSMIDLFRFPTVAMLAEEIGREVNQEHGAEVDVIRQTLARVRQQTEELQQQQEARQESRRAK